jgi:hypothetical protein
MHLAAVAFNVGVGLYVVIAFFRPLRRICEEQPHSAFAVKFLSWSIESATSVRIIKLLAVFKPTVLGVLQSGLSTSLNMPLPVTFSGWRLMWVGDGVATVICEGLQTAVLIVSTIQCHEPILQLGILPSLVFSGISIMMAVAQSCSAAFCETYQVRTPQRLAPMHCTGIRVALHWQLIVYRKSKRYPGQSCCQW